MQNERQLMQQATAKMHETFDKLEAMYGKKVGRPARIKWYTNGRTAGSVRCGMKVFRMGRRGPRRVVLGPESAIRMRLHLGLLLQNPQEMIEQTVPHECCHIYADRFYEADCNHGHLWGGMMVRLGLSPDRCHDMDTSQFTKPAPYIYTCGCNTPHKLTATRHRNLLNNPRRKLICRKCKFTIKFSHMEGRKPAPQPVVVTVAKAACAPAATPTAGVAGESKADKARRIMRAQIALGTNESDIIGLIASECDLSRGIAKSYYKNNLAKI